MWKSKKYDQALLFQFQKNGQINVYVDQDDDWNFGRKKDRLIGKNNNFDKENFSKNFFTQKKKVTLFCRHIIMERKVNQTAMNIGWIYTKVSRVVKL